MKRNHVTIIAFMLLLFSLSFTLIACNQKKAIVEIDGNKLTLDDFLYDIYLIELERDIWNDSYKEMLGVDYWEYEFEGMNMEQLAKDTIMTSVILYNILYDRAQIEGYTLNKDELATNEAQVDEFIASISEKDLKGTGMNRDVLIRAFNKLSQADKYYSAIINDYEVDEESIRESISPDEYREYRTECLYVPTAEVSKQSITPFDENELKKSNDKILEIKELILKGSGFDQVLEQVEGVAHYERSFILSDNTAEEEYKKAAKELDNGDYSDVITTKFGLYIIHMLNNNSPVRYEKAIANAIADKKTYQFKQHYDELLKEYDIQINNEYWDSLDIGSITSK